MLARIEEEGGLMGGSVDMVIVLEFCHGQEVCPVVLPLVYEESDVLFQLLVNTFRLAIRLRVISGRESRFDINEPIEFFGELCRELGTSI
jgi:hypothetical protein